VVEKMIEYHSLHMDLLDLTVHVRCLYRGPETCV